MANKHRGFMQTRNTETQEFEKFLPITTSDEVITNQTTNESLTERLNVIDLSIEQAENNAKAYLDNQNQKVTHKKTLQPGENSVTVPDQTPGRLRMFGRTQVNLLGDSGSFSTYYEVVNGSRTNKVGTGWVKTVAGRTDFLSNLSSFFREGANIVGLGNDSVNDATDAGSTRWLETAPSHYFRVEAGKSYIVVMNLTNSSATEGLSVSAFYGPNAEDVTTVPVPIRSSANPPFFMSFTAPADFAEAKIRITNSTPSGASIVMVYFEAVGVYESNKGTIESVTPNNVRTLFPHVDGRKSIKNPVIINRSKNLLSGRGQLRSIPSIDQVSNYDLRSTSTAGSLVMLSLYALVEANTDYTFSFEGDAAFAVTAPTGSALVAVTSSGNKVTFNTGTRISIIINLYSQATGRSTIARNWQLEKGLEATSFVERRTSPTVIDTELRSLANFSDTLDINGNTATLSRQIHPFVFNTLQTSNTIVVAATNGSYHYIAMGLTASSISGPLSEFIAFNGMKFRWVTNTGSFTAPYQYTYDANLQRFYVSLPTTVTGWNAGAAQSVGAGRVLLSGWRVSKYTGTTAVEWTPINGTAEQATTNGGDTAVFAPGWNGIGTLYAVTGDTLSLDVPVDGPFMLYPGDNKIQVLAGAISREKMTMVNPLGGQLEYSYGRANSAYQTSQRAREFLAMYADGMDTTEAWYSRGLDLTYYHESWGIRASDLNRNARLTTTYLSGDSYLTSTYTNTIHFLEYDQGVSALLEGLNNRVTRTEAENDQQYFADNYIQAAVENARRDLDDVRTRLSTTARKEITLSGGMRVVKADKRSVFTPTKIKGRTLINLVGLAGTCERESDFSLVYGMSTALEPANAAYGDAPGKGLALNVPSGSGIYTSMRSIPIPKLVAGVYYVAIMNGTCTNPASRLYVSVRRSTGIAYTNEVAGAVSTTISSQYPSTSFLAFQADGTEIGVGPYFWTETYPVSYSFDSIRLYEISITEFNALSAGTLNINETFPFTTHISGVHNPYAIRYGTNLLPDFTEWYVQGGGLRDVLGPYSLYWSKPTVTGDFNLMYIDIPVIPGQKYTFGTNISAGSIIIHDYRRNRANLPNEVTYLYKEANPTANTIQFIGPASGIVRIHFYSYDMSTVTPTYSPPVPSPASHSVITGTWASLTLGWTSPQFIGPRDDRMMAFNTTLFGRPGVLSESYAMDLTDDIIYQGRDYIVQQRWRLLEMAKLDVSWSYLTKTSTFHVVTYMDAGLGIRNSGVTTSNVYGVKPNGQALASMLYNVVTANPDGVYIDGNGKLHISVLTSLSGWGPSYNPTPEEIKAFFLGWKMYDGSQTSTYNTVYNGTAGQTKAWVRLNWVMGIGSNTNTTTLPIASYPDFVGYQVLVRLGAVQTYTPNIDGQVILEPGLNLIEVGSGAIIRESVFTETDSVSQNINNGTPGFERSWTKYKIARVLNVFKNGKMESWRRSLITTTQNGMLAQIINSYFDKTASYSVSYIKSDPTPINDWVGVISTTEQAQIEQLMDNVSNVLERVGALENIPAMNTGPDWIKPTLLNSWTNYWTEFPARYTKLKSGLVVLAGRINGGTLGNTAFILPEGMRPGRPMVLLGHTYGGSSPVGKIIIHPDGRVIPSEGSASEFSFDGVTFVPY